MFSGATLKYTGASAVTDRGATLNGAGGIFDVAGGATLTLNGVITGPGALTLTDSGTLTLANTNNYTGGTFVNAGQLVYSVATAIPATGTLTLNGAGVVTVTPANGLPGVLVNGTNSITGNGNTGTGIASLDVAGTLTLFVSGGSTVFDLTGPMTGPGNLVLGTPAMNLRFNGTAGDGGAIFNLGTGTAVASVRNNAAAIALGGLAGGSGTQLQGNNSFAVGTIYTIGGANTNTEFDGAIKDGADASVSVIKTGVGSLILGGANTYTGSTTVSNGTLVVKGSVGNGAVTVAGGTLGGGGTVGGAVSAQAGGVIAPGANTNVAGTVLTIANSLALNAGSGVTLTVSHNNHTNDQIACLAIIYGGTLTVTTIAGDAPLVAGDTFRLFNASLGLYTGSFSATNLPALSPGLIWSNSLAINGTIGVTGTVAQAPVTISGGAISGGMFVISGTNGVPGAQYRILETTNAALAITNWTPVWTNVFGAGGSFSYTNTPGVNPAGFFLLVSP
jgi:autotransporter-associated beta strand protein